MVGRGAVEVGLLCQRGRQFDSSGRASLKTSSLFKVFTSYTGSNAGGSLGKDGGFNRCSLSAAFILLYF